MLAIRCVGMGHRTAGLPSLLHMFLVLLRILLGQVPAQNRTSQCRVVFVCVHRRATVVHGSQTWHRSTLPTSGESLHRRSALQLHMSQVTARDSAWRWTATVLAATTQQVGQSYVRLGARTLFSPSGGNALSTLRASEYLKNASLQGWVADGKTPRGHDLDTSQLNVLDNPSKNVKRMQQRATRRSANNLPETMLTQSEFCRPVTWQSYTHTLRPRRLRCVRWDPTTPVGRGPCDA